MEDIDGRIQESLIHSNRSFVFRPSENIVELKRLRDTVTAALAALAKFRISREQ